VDVTIDRLLDGKQLREQLAADVRAGLARTPRAVRSRWVWDARGSELFDRIVELASYDLPRRERAILEARAPAIADAVRPETVLELGSGSSPRTPVLLDVLVAAGLRRFVAMDVSEAALRGALPRLAERYPDVDVRGVVGDFEHQLGLVDRPGRTLVLLLGSTIGALEKSERASLLAEIAGTLGLPGDAFLLGVDLVKPEAQIRAAYAHPDELAGGLIANLLPIVNRELGADFDPSRFRPESSWNADEERLETVVRSLGDQIVTIAALDIALELSAGETIRTQVSAKFRREGVEAELATAGLRLESWWTDPGDGFAIALARRSESPGVSAGLG
jgi:L-histidine N-alpha-methyltransferase